MQVVFLQIVGLQVTLHGEHLGHAVGDGRARGEDDTAAALHGLDMAHLEIHIESPFAGGLRQTGNARHLGDVKEIFEVVRLVHENAVHAEFLEGQRVILFVVGGQSLEFGFEPFLRLFQFLDQSAVGTAGVFPPDHFQLVKLFVKEPLFCVVGERDALEP